MTHVPVQKGVELPANLRRVELEAKSVELFVDILDEFDKPESRPAMILKMRLEPAPVAAPLAADPEPIPERQLVKRGECNTVITKGLQAANEARNQYNLMIRQIGACQTRMREIEAEAPAHHDTVFSQLARELGFEHLDDLRAKGFELGVDPKDNTWTLLQNVSA